MTSSGGLPYADVTGRMELFGRIFGEQVGVAQPQALPSADDLVRVVKERVPRSPAIDDAPVFEAAAYVGEWLRTRADATWIAEGPYEPHLQLVDRSRAVVYLLPLVNLLRTASTAGYDGLPSLLAGVLADVSRPAVPAPLEELRVEPDEDRPRVVAWVRRHRHLRDATRAALWRRCAACATPAEEALTLHNVSPDWESDSAAAASILGKRPFRCPCGGLPGEATRFLILRADADGLRLADIHVTGTRTRIGCWGVGTDRVVPLDALRLAGEERAPLDDA